jgi:hypothetical protein
MVQYNNSTFCKPDSADGWMRKDDSRNIIVVKFAIGLVSEESEGS